MLGVYGIFNFSVSRFDGLSSDVLGLGSFSCVESMYEDRVISHIQTELERIRFRESILPMEIQPQLTPGVGLLADVNLGETDAEQGVSVVSIVPHPV